MSLIKIFSFFHLFFLPILSPNTKPKAYPDACDSDSSIDIIDNKFLIPRRPVPHKTVSSFCYSSCATLSASFCSLCFRRGSQAIAYTPTQDWGTTSRGFELAFVYSNSYSNRRITSLSCPGLFFDIGCPANVSKHPRSENKIHRDFQTCTFSAGCFTCWCPTALCFFFWGLVYGSSLLQGRFFHYLPFRYRLIPNLLFRFTNERLFWILLYTLVVVKVRKSLLYLCHAQISKRMKVHVSRSRTTAEVNSFCSRTFSARSLYSDFLYAPSHCPLSVRCWYYIYGLRRHVPATSGCRRPGSMLTPLWRQGGVLVLPY